MQNEIDKKRLKTEQLNARKAELLKKMEAVKFSGSGSSEFNRDMIDKLSRDQDELHRRLKVVRTMTIFAASPLVQSVFPCTSF